MKKLNILLLLSFVFVALSCSKWLDVKPKAEIKSDVMLETEQGFKDAMVGCYMLTSNKTLYGQELTLTFLDGLAQQYKYKTEGDTYPYYLSSRYEYNRSSVESIKDKIWLDMYNVIANLNNIINNIDAKESIMSPISYNVIKGEAYGLRAFLHLDLLRMFGYGDLANRPEKLNEISIPYRTKYEKSDSPKLKIQDVLDKIKADLDVAIPLLYSYDPISKIAERPVDYYLDIEDLFMKKRSYHFNYNAAVATKMRLLMWEGKEGYVQEVLALGDALIKTGTLQWISADNINNVIISERDLSFSNEQLFGVETYDRQEFIIERYFKVTLSTEFTSNSNAMFIPKTKADDIFEIMEDIGVSDYRYLRQLENVKEELQIIKYWNFLNNTGAVGPYANAQPLLRTSEVYYMMAECRNRNGETAEAIKLLNTVRKNRGIAPQKDIALSLDEEGVAKEIEKEYKKEFISEGQLFYFYKRLGYMQIDYSSTPELTDKEYVIPAPIF